MGPASQGESLVAAAEGLTDEKGMTALAEWGLILRRRIPGSLGRAWGCVDSNGGQQIGEQHRPLGAECGRRSRGRRARLANGKVALTHMAPMVG